MNIVGLDLSLTATGVAHPDGTTTVWNTNHDHGDRRLVDIRDQLTELVHTAHPTLAVIEDLPTHAHGAGKTAMVHGIVREHLLRRRIPFVLVVAASLKKYATGKGNATKPDMRLELFKRAGLDLRDDNEVDAWWLRAMGLDHYGTPPLPMPAANRASLTKVNWPQVGERAA